jgi:hypothetical protein
MIFNSEARAFFLQAAMSFNAAFFASSGLSTTKEYRSAYMDADFASVSITAAGTPILPAIPFVIRKAVMVFPKSDGPDNAHRR